MKYINYKKFSVEYDENNHEFSYFDDSMGQFLQRGRISGIVYGTYKFSLKDYDELSTRSEDIPDGRKLVISYSKGPELLPYFGIVFLIDKNVIKCEVLVPGHADIRFEADLCWGSDMLNSTYAVCPKGGGNGLRAACGPASSKVDNALYDRITDSILEIDMCDRERLVFNWEKNCYSLNMSTGGHDYIKGFKIKTCKNYYAEKFTVPFKPINKNHQFPTPPVGWMTWYSVQFNASDKTVLENAKWVADNLKEYGANCIWVDWEWYHSDMSGKESSGVDTFHPKKERYPDGLKYISDEIRKLRLIPALWIGATNDTNLNMMLANNPQWVLTNQYEWCGQWWIDPSHPGIVADYIPAVFKQLLDWGYEAFKWDCLGKSLEIFDQHHDRFYNKRKTSEQAFRDIVQAARNVIGDDRYMMSCSGSTSRDIMFAADKFDGSRIGGDIFKWEEFITQCIDPTLKYYVYHNVIWYADMDNIIIRKEFNNMDQARSRVSFYALSGVPVTLGDNLPELEKERVDILKRALPVVDIHPMDIKEIKRDTSYVLVNLNIAKSFGTWNVIDVLNTGESEEEVRLDFDRDLCLDTGFREEYALYDFWEDKFLGIRKESIDLVLPPCGSRVISINKINDYPQIISTSRHITQGAFDIQTIAWDPETCVLRVKSNVICGEPYKAVIYVPENYEFVEAEAGHGTGVNTCMKEALVLVVELEPGKTDVEEWAALFREKI